MVGSLLLATGGWIGFRGWQARAHLLNAAGLARELSAQVVGGDPEPWPDTATEPSRTDRAA
ncbi:hypothetical protein, partial [Micromonospora sp. NPDC005113]